MSYQILKLKPVSRTDVDYTQEGVYHAVLGKTALCAEDAPNRHFTWNEMPGFHVNCVVCLQALQPSSEVKPHIKFLLEAEQNSETSLMWGRVGNSSTIWISTLGYRHMEHYALEAALLHLGCQYDFEHGKLQAFDQLSGRTITHLKEVAK